MERGALTDECMDAVFGGGVASTIGLERATFLASTKITERGAVPLAALFVRGSEP
jgi:hypothetical protein